MSNMEYSDLETVPLFILGSDTVQVTRKRCGDAALLHTWLHLVSGKACLIVGIWNVCM
jgi:hypothetical protein